MAKTLKSVRVPVREVIRYRICGDDSGHEYFVPVDQEELFESWVASFNDGEEFEYEGPDFEANRIDGRFTFTDPRND
jgi:hypothetical protein